LGGFGIWVFAYGSLMDPAEAARTLGRVPEMRPAVVEDLARSWCVGTAGRAYACEACGGRLPVAVVLGVRPAAGARTSGVVLRLTGAERRSLDRREASYTPAWLAPDAVHARPPLPRDAEVLVYVPDPRRLAAAGRPGAAIPAAYAGTVARALAAAWPGHPPPPLVTAVDAGPVALREGLRFAGPDPGRRVPDCGCGG
jgi:cation transport regulator ChaC